MRWIHRIGLCSLIMLLSITATAGFDGDIWVGEKVPSDPVPGDNRVVHECLRSNRHNSSAVPLSRLKPWSLPLRALAPDTTVTIHCLVLRFNFQFESSDDPNSTGRGRFNLDTPLSNSTDSANYFDTVGHLVDPPPHDSIYFDSHMRALSRYWETVSEGKVVLTWDIYPPTQNGAYDLPYPMSHYGICNPDSVVIGLEQYFVDAITLADSVSPQLHFADYDSYFLFHAGADRQNDLGFPPTCNDLFTGYINYFADPASGRDTVWVDSGSYAIWDGLLMPESANQDNRATALNAVLAHEFGHQLGLVDIYSTRTFLTQLGDFELMDNNGFGTGIDFGFPVGRVFGAIPLYPSAWSRAFLGFVDVVDYREGSDVRVVAAEAVSQGIKIARVPISENEYYLIENRNIELDGIETAMLIDSNTYVFQGPVNRLTRQFTSEYDFLMPGSGMLIYHVDEGVAGLDYDGDSTNNFDDNDLQWDPSRKFIQLVEADGLIGFGGYYRVGFGSEDDMFREDRHHSFTPNTNPPAIDNSGNNTHVFVTNIRRDSALVNFQLLPQDSVMLFDVETDKLVDGFPVRNGFPAFGISPIADDIDGDGTDEIIMVANQYLNVFTSSGDNFLCSQVACNIAYFDRAYASVYPDTGRPHALPLYAMTPLIFTTAPVTGTFVDNPGTKLIAVGSQFAQGSPSGKVVLYAMQDNNGNALADSVGVLRTFNQGTPIALSFGNILYALTDRNLIVRKDSLAGGPDHTPLDSIEAEELHGICRIGDRLVVLAGDSLSTFIQVLDTNLNEVYSLGNYSYNFGPIIVDVNRDSQPEVVAFTPEGRGILVTVDTSAATPVFSILEEKETSYEVTTNPVAGDVDADGYPDLIIGGVNAVYSFNRELTLITDYPVQPNDRFPTDPVVAAPVSADIQQGQPPEVIFPTFVGNINAVGREQAYGFPVSAGEIITYVDSVGWTGGYFAAGSPLVFHDSTGGKLGYLGADGWFYAWEVDLDTITNYWPMSGHDPSGSFAFDNGQLPSPREFSILLPKERFYNYPNPVVDGSTRIRFFLGKDATSVQMKMFDMSGTEVSSMPCPTAGGIDHEMEMDCSSMTPGIYRCVIKADFGGQTETAHSDMAIIR